MPGTVSPARQMRTTRIPYVESPISGHGQPFVGSSGDRAVAAGWIASTTVPEQRRRFRPYEHLRRRDDFARVFAARCRAGDDVLLVYAVANDLEWSRIGMSVSRRIGNAVVRNFVRRRIREAFRGNKDRIPRGFDFVCVAKANAQDRQVDVEASLVRLAARAVSRSKPS